MAPLTKSRKNENQTRKNKPKKGIQKKRIFFKYTEEALADAIKDIKNNVLGIRAASRHYSVPRSTIQDRLSGRTSEKPRKVGPAPLLGYKGEEKVVDWIINLAKCGIPVSKRNLLETVGKILTDLGKTDKLNSGNLPGETWYSGFLRRHPEISVREPESINKARECVRESTLRKWFEELKCFLREKGAMDIMQDPDRIFNADETGVLLCPKTGKVLAPRGYKNVYKVKEGNEKENLTVLVTMTASGKICPPVVVFPYLRPPHKVIKSVPKDWVVGKTESGWMRSSVFFEFIANDFDNWLIKNEVKKPIIFFVDGHRSHMSMQLSQFCDDNDIILYALPPNTTHITQPADVSVFRPLKHEWKKTVEDWKSKPGNKNKSITKENFCQVFKETMNIDMAQTIRNGFRKCGLYPFNVEAIDFTKCVKDFQEKTKRISVVTSNELEDRDFIAAQKVVNYIKENLVKRGIDLNIIYSEIESARINSKEKRRSKSKTPRTSTEIAKGPNRGSDSAQREITTPRACNDKEQDKEGSYSLLDDISIPDVGSLVSLNDISVINISDLNLEQSKAKYILEIDTETQDDCLVSEPLSPIDKASCSKIITTAIVHVETLAKDNINTQETTMIDLNPKPQITTKTSSTICTEDAIKIINTQETTMIDLNPKPQITTKTSSTICTEDAIEILNTQETTMIDLNPKSQITTKTTSIICTEDATDIEYTQAMIDRTPKPHIMTEKKSFNCTEDSKTSQNKYKITDDHTDTDPFSKHLMYIDKTETKTKRKNITKYPSAISAKAWRDHYESKEKIKQNIENQKLKRKAEREEKKNKSNDMKLNAFKKKQRSQKHNETGKDNIEGTLNENSEGSDNEIQIRRITTNHTPKLTNLQNKKNTERYKENANSSYRKMKLDSGETKSQRNIKGKKGGNNGTRVAKENEENQIEEKNIPAKNDLKAWSSDDEDISIFSLV